MTNFEEWDKITGITKPNKFQEWDKITEINKNKPDQFSLGQRGAQVLHGAASGLEGLGNITAKGVSALHKITSPMAEKMAMKIAPEKIPEIAQENANIQSQLQPLQNSPFQGILTNPINEMAGRNLTPEEGDLTGKILHTTGEFLTPLPIPGAGGSVSAAQSGVKSLGKLLGKEAVGALGSSTALEAKPKFTDEGTIGRTVEDFADIILGGRAANKLTGKAGKIANDIYKTKKEGRILESIKEFPVKASARALSKFSHPDKEVYELADRHGIDLPPTVGAKNSVLNWFHNNFLKSMFTSKAYKDIFNKADSQMYKKFKDSIDTLGSQNLTKSEAASEYTTFLKKEKEELRNKTEQLYNSAVIKHSKSEQVPLTHTKKAISELKAILKAPALDPESSQVLKVASQIADNWGIFKETPDLKVFRSEKYDDSRLLEKILSQIDEKSNVSREIGDIAQQRTAIRKMMQNKDLRGARGLLTNLYDALENDIKLSKNKQFIEEWEGANNFYKKNVGERIKADLAHGMLTGKAPRAALDAMDTIEGIKEVERITGDSTLGKKAFDDLKKTKLRGIFKGAIEGTYKDGSLKKAPFAKIFQKEDGKQDVIERLIGEQEYKKLSDISKIAADFSNSGKELYNTSHSDISRADRDRVESVAKETLRLFFSTSKSILGGAGAGAGIGGMAGAAIGAVSGAAAPWLLSKLMSNPVFIRESRIYALQRQAGKEAQAKKTLNRLLKISDSEARKSAVQLNRIMEKEESEGSEKSID